MFFAIESRERSPNILIHDSHLSNRRILGHACCESSHTTCAKLVTVENSRENTT
jgi:hypothetical protein